MSASKIAICYSAALGTVRWVLVPDDDSELEHSWHQAGHGERRLVVPIGQYIAYGAQALVNEVTGREAKPGIDDRFAVIDEHGEVIAAIIDDPTCHPDMSRHPYAGHRLVQHADATRG